MFGLGTQEVLIILAIGLLLFGHRLPELARSLGKGIVEFRKETNKLSEG
jgi:sec-independent protein translocase protein TatA